MRIWADSDGIERWNLMHFSLYIDLVSCGASGRRHIYITESSADRWNHIEGAIKPDGDLSNGGGITWYRNNGKQVAYSDNLWSCQGMYDYIDVYGVDPSITDSYPETSVFRWGELYADSTLARVIVSGEAIYNVSSEDHWEIQPPTTWSPTSISVTFNKGSFANRRRVYLYVIRADGVVSNSGVGVPIYIGARFTPKEEGGYQPTEFPDIQPEGE